LPISCLGTLYQTPPDITRPPLPYAYPKTIHTWRRERRKNQKIQNKEKGASNFIEVPIKEDIVRAKLKKAELVYEKFRIEIEGEISSAKIAPIMQILEG